MIDAILGDHPERPAVLVPGPALQPGEHLPEGPGKGRRPALRGRDRPGPRPASLRPPGGRLGPVPVTWLTACSPRSPSTCSAWRSGRRAGLSPSEELDRLHEVYDQVLAPKDASILDTRRLAFTQVCLYLGAWITTIAASLLVLFEWAHIDSTIRPIPPSGPGRR